METILQLIWAIGLVGALIPTLIILKEVALLLRTLRHILTLAEWTRDAAHGIVDNTRVASQLSALAEPAGRLQTAAIELAGAVQAMERQLQALGGERR